MKSWRREETAESGCFRLEAVSQHLDQQQGVKSGMPWLLLSGKGGTDLGEIQADVFKAPFPQSSDGFFFFLERMLFLLFLV